MPKGTGRPNTRKEREAIETLRSIQQATRNFSGVNRAAAMSGERATAARKALSDREEKEAARNLGRKMEKTKGVGVPMRPSAYSKGYIKRK